MNTPPQVSEHYLGNKGKHYFDAKGQRDAGRRGYAINARYFAPYVQPGKRVLDFGCSNGGMILHLQKMGALVEGLEMNPAARELGLQTGAVIYVGLEEIPEDAKYDVVVSNHVLEHVPNVVEVLRQLRQHIVPGGLFVTKVPYEDVRSRHQRSWSRDDVNHHLQTWTPRLFANVLYESGFEVEDVRVITSAWSPKLFKFQKIGLEKLAFWAFAVLMHRRQLFAVGRNPG